MIDFLPPSTPMLAATSTAPTTATAMAGADGKRQVASPRSSTVPPSSGQGRWRYAFDRWLVVADAESEFVLA